MKLLDLLGLGQPTLSAMPPFIRDIRDIGPVRVVRLQGPVGKEIGDQVRAANEQAEQAAGTFTRPLLIDFAGTTDWDFSTISYMVQTLRRRMAAGAPVGIINAPARLIAELELAKLGGLFRAFASEDEALAALGRDASRGKA